MKQFATYKEYRNSSNNEASENSLYMVNGNTEQIHRIQGQDWSRRKMISLIVSLNLNDFITGISEDDEEKILRLFERNGYVPAAYYQESKYKDFLFVRK